jgi:hypothetical protein
MRNIAIKRGQDRGRQGKVAARRWPERGRGKQVDRWPSGRVREIGLRENEDGSWKGNCYGVRVMYKIYV